MPSDVPPTPPPSPTPPAAGDPASGPPAPEGFIDLHCHLLPGVDDGPATMDEALALCRGMVANGVRIATATPHQSHTWPENTAPAIRAAVKRLAARLESEGIPLEVHPGADVRVDADFLTRWQAGELLSVGDRGRAVMLELPDNVLVPLDGLSFELRVRRVVPVLTHPERCIPLQNKWDTLTEWVEQGLVLQVTTGSLLGEFGRQAKAAGLEMIRRGLVGFLASDAHGPVKRPPNHRAAWEFVVSTWGEPAARKLMLDHPAKVFEGKSVPPVTVKPDAVPAATVKAGGGFWRRLFGG